MTEPFRTSLPFMRRVLAVFADADIHDMLFWKVLGENIEFYVICNDLFWWATADAEQITDKNIDVLEQTWRDLNDLGRTTTRASGQKIERKDIPSLFVPDLFAARSRGMRPQRPFYKDLSPELAELFNACGPERDPASEG